MTAASDDRSALDLLRGSRITAYSIGLLSLIGGIVLLAWPTRSVEVVARIIGILFIVSGFGQAAEALTTHRRGSYWGLLLLRGIINLGIGIALLFVPGKSTDVVVWLVGLDFVITGVLAFIVVFLLPKDMGRGRLMFEAVLSIAVGVVIFWAGPDSVKTIVAVAVGIVLVLIGLVFLYSGYQLSKAAKEMAA